MVSKPTIEINTSPFYLPTMSIAITTDMVNGKELDMSLATTGADSTTVRLEGLQPQFVSPSYVGKMAKPLCFFFISRTPSLTTFVIALFMTFVISLSVNTKLFLMDLVVSLSLCSLLFSVTVRHKNTAPHQLAALTRQAGERQLVGSIA